MDFSLELGRVKSDKDVAWPNPDAFRNKIDDGSISLELRHDHNRPFGFELTLILCPNSKILLRYPSDGRRGIGWSENPGYENNAEKNPQYR